MNQDQKEISTYLMEMAFTPGSAVSVKRLIGGVVQHGLVHSIGGGYYTLVSRDTPEAATDYNHGHLIVNDGWIVD